MPLQEVPPAAELAETYNKPVSTLAIVPTHRSLTVTARKVYNVMGRIAQRAGDTGDEGYAAPLAAVLRKSRNEGASAQTVKRYLDEMVVTKVEWRQLASGDEAPDVHEGDGALLLFTLLSQVRLYKVGRDNWLQWWYPPAIKQQMLAPERWAQINLNTVALLGHYCDVALYEICARYQGNGRTGRHRGAWWVQVLSGSAEDVSREWRKFKSEKVMPAIRRINAVAEIEIELHEPKEHGRLTGEVQFLVRRKPEQPGAAAEEPAAVDASLPNKALQLGIREHDFDALVDRYGEEALRRALATLERHVEAGKAGDNRLTHLRWVLSGAVEKPERKPVPRLSPAPPPPPEAIPEPRAEEWAMAEEAFKALPRQEQFRWLELLRQDMVERGAPLSKAMRDRIDAGQWLSPVVRVRLLPFFLAHREA